MCIESGQFISEIHKDLLCPICLGVLCIDCLVDANDHAYCKRCILRWLRKGNEKCPIGNETIELSTLKPIIRIIKNILCDFELYCKYRNEGCKKVLRYEVYNKHELQCAFKPVKPKRDVKRNVNTIYSSGLQNDNIVSNKLNKIPAESICSMIGLNDEEILITDIGASSLIVIDYDGNLINEPFNPENTLDDPLSICTNSKNEILVGDSKQFKIFVFDKNFLYNYDFGSAATLAVPNYMRCDVEQNDELYISHYSRNTVTIWTNTNLTHTIDVEAPLDIAISKENLYISSAIKFEVDDASNELKKINNGLNCIFLFSKLTFEVLKTIQMNWLSPGGLFLDHEFNIYTVAYELTDEKYKSQYKFLFVINNSGELVKKVELKELKGITDMLIVENKIIFCADYNYIRTFQFMV